MGCGYYKDNNEAFASLEKLAVIEPNLNLRPQYLDAYAEWKDKLNKII